jgi:hypothetical protein
VKIGLVVDGESEFRAMPSLFSELADLTGHQFIGPNLAKVPPTAPVGIVAAVCAREVAQLQVAEPSGCSFSSTGKVARSVLGKLLTL